MEGCTKFKTGVESKRDDKGWNKKNTIQKKVGIKKDIEEKTLRVFLDFFMCFVNANNMFPRPHCNTKVTSEPSYWLFYLRHPGREEGIQHFILSD